MTIRTTGIIAALATTALLLGACTSNDADTPGETTAAGTSATGVAETTAASTDAVAPVVTLEDGFVREKAADSMMTGVFGTLTNHTGEALELVGFQTDLGSGTNEIHEVVDGVMRPKSDPMIIPADGTYELVPGGDHLMIMGVEGDIPAGDVVTLTLEFADGSTVDVPEVPVRTVLAGEENYGADGGLQGHSPESAGETSAQTAR
ncbi:copper chaperone PCu(A)C [Corynebacterium guangdongense]|uniref:Copper(I)-binding protein n=1 Tax=Corynebacterium guangdongense TaxID=1783348 RepID=A0ABU1ZX30_9CORY|nr:copper chaperone PCu(A)C [Corynebacterium guangdongense]MDR7329475.1 copper(I)-binding protein [Corynebacterium guangdongense]WJZ18040.1 hypothetical protein CGUA_07355 [Corynebacterium guangdongense]